jgi:ATP-dependent Clp protease ATP-binding subunit ClpC
MSASVSIKLGDLVAQAHAGKLQDVVERDQELGRLVRILLRPTHHNVVIVAEPGTGKSSLIEALAVRLDQGKYRPLEPKLYRLGTEPIMGLMVNGDSLKSCLNALRAATAQLTSAIIVVEDIQLLAADDPGRLELTLALLTSIASHPGIRLITTTTTNAYHRIFSDDYLFNRSFYALDLPEATTEAITNMVEVAVPNLERMNHQVIEQTAIEQAVLYGKRFGHGRALPDAAVRLLEETCIMASLEGRDNVTATDIHMVVSERERLPISDLASTEDDSLMGLEEKLRLAVVGQPAPLRTIAGHLARAQLGLRDPTKPRGSFLLLGPSGVGKTETAKALASNIFQGPDSLIRLDMSEYSEAHAAVRLIGSPPGYVGYEEGGQLTGAVMREPYSLVLLDEIEKAHHKLFDLFLQLLDDGRLTDSSGHTVDFSETLVLATSNTGSSEIAQGVTQGWDVSSPEFMQAILLPKLMQTYRPEFINRFDAILVYQPLTEGHLVSLAQRELERLSIRLNRLGISFDVPDAVLATMLRPLLNPLFGARPVKRLIANRFETPIAEQLLQRNLTGPVVITGQEPWLAQGAIA